MTATAWTSFVTGKGPGKHGIYDWTEPMPRSYVYEPVDSRKVKSETILEMASEAGLRVASVNLPLTYPCRPLNGVAVSGMLTPDKSSPGFTYPPSFKEEIERLSPDYLIDTHLSDSFEDIIPFCDRLEAMLEERGKVVRHLLDQEPWDLFVTVWVEMDRMQHCIWQFIDPKHPFYDPEGAARYEERILDVYRLLDVRVGEMVDRRGDNCDIIFISDHGFGPCRAKVFLNTWLAKAGFLAFKEGGSEKRGRLNQVRGLMDKVGLDTRKIVETAKRFGAGRLIRSQGAALSRFASGIDWAQTQAFCHGTNSIRINLEGREPQGSVSTEDYEGVRQAIKEALLAMRDADGNVVVTDVQTREELYSGPEVDRASDLFIADHDHAVWFYYSEGEMPDTLFENSGWASGNHKPNGIFLGHGPSFSKGTWVDEPKIIDIAPTLLSLLGIPIPDDVDGRVLKETFAKGQCPEVLWREATGFAGVAGTGFSDAERAEIEERLRGLGYLQ
jgi:predicted AlkP superfamily phosphohydrolase/phosphomutase